MSPSVGSSKPRAIAIGASMAKFSQRIDSGLRGIPSAIVESCADESPGRPPMRHLKHVLQQVVVQLPAVLDGGDDR
jgi:hypothetical protein